MAAFEAESLVTLFFIVILSAVAIITKHYAYSSYYQFFKPLPLIVLILHCLFVRIFVNESDFIIGDTSTDIGVNPTLQVSHPYEDNFTCIIIGLFLGMFGDIAVTFDRLRILGALSFICGHIVYIVGFTYKISWNLHNGVMAGFLLLFSFCAVVFAFLMWRNQYFRRSVKTLMLIIGEIYLAVMSAMVLTAFNWDFATRPPHPSVLLQIPVVSIGAILYFISDVLLVISGIAKNKFLIGIFVSMSYYSSQTCIAYGMSFKYLSYQ